MRIFANEAEGPPPGDPDTYAEIRIRLAGKTSIAEVATAIAQAAVPGSGPYTGFDAAADILGGWVRDHAGGPKVVLVEGLGDVMRADPVLALTAATVIQGAEVDAFRTLCEEDRCAEAKTELYQVFAFLD